MIDSIACTRAGAPVNKAHGVANADAATLLMKIEALTVDAASDEVLAGELMRGHCQLADEQALTPTHPGGAAPRRNVIVSTFCEDHQEARTCRRIPRAAGREAVH